MTDPRNEGASAPSERPATRPELIGDAPTPRRSVDPVEQPVLPPSHRQAAPTTGARAAGAAGAASTAAEGVREPAGTAVTTTTTSTTSGAAAAVAAAAKGEPARARTGADAAARARRRTRKARLRIARVDPWSVMKTSLLFGVAGAIIWVIAAYFVMQVIESSGLFAAINQAVKDVLSSPSDTSPFAIETYVNTKRVTGLAALIGFVDVVLLTVLATLFSFLYNLSATMLGGLEITLAED